MAWKFIKQSDEKDCGPVCLAMISNYYGKKVSVAKIREYSETNLYGTSIIGMITAGEILGLNLEAFELDKRSTSFFAVRTISSSARSNESFPYDAAELVKLRSALASINSLSVYPN